MQTTKHHAKYKPLSTIVMLGLGLVIGVLGGYCAILFRVLISYIHNAAFFGFSGGEYDANVHTSPSIWGAGFIFIPALGAVIVTYLVRQFAPEAKGHGVPEVIDAIYHKEGKIRPQIVLLKALCSALTIGTGGSVGREGPIIQIGSALGSFFGQWVHMPVRQRITLIAAGAGAGIAATFNAPIGGIAFAVELLLVAVNASTLSVVTVATITAAFIGRHYLGLYPAFDVPELADTGHNLALWQLLLFIPFGILVGLSATLFIKTIYRFEDFMDQLPVNIYVRNAVGMSLFGMILYAFMLETGHYYVQGVGYATIVDILAGLIASPWFLFGLFFAKLISTSLTLSCGGSGGVFSPSLFLGACLGSACGKLLLFAFPQSAMSPVVFAIAGMAGMVSGTTGAVLTAISMLFEMTHDYSAILPIMLTVTLAYITRVTLNSESIYNLKLLRRGRDIHEGLQAAIKTAQRARNIMNKSFYVISHDSISEQDELIQLAQLQGITIVVEEDKFIIGTLLPGSYNLLREYEYAASSTSLINLLRIMDPLQHKVVLIMDDKNSHHIDNLIGIVTPYEITETTSHTAQLMNESA